jgi:integrase
MTPHGPAQLYRTKRSDTPWQVVFADPSQREPSGRRKRIVKWFAHREPAEAYQLQLNERLRVEGTAALAFDADLRSDAVRARERLNAAGLTGVTLAEVAAVFIAGRPEAAEARLALPALHAFLEEKELVEGAAVATVTTLRNRLGTWLAVSGVRTLDGITRAQVEALRARPGVTAQSRRNDMAALSVWCSWLLDKGWIAAHPLRGLRRPKLPPANKATFSAEECGRLLAAARGYLGGKWLGTIAVMLWTGCRPSELAQTRIIYDEGGVARIEGGKLKGRANRTVPLSDAARAWLAVAGNPERVAPINTRARRNLAEQAGVTWRPDVTRHTWISNRCALVQNDAQMAREAGTSQEMIHRHYHSLRLAREAQAWAGLRP